MKTCKFCSGDVDPVECGDSDVCDPCWYGMRMDPEGFQAQMKSLGVSLSDNAHGWLTLEDGRVIHVNRDPFKPGPVKLVKP